MATVITVPRDSALQFRLVVGTNPLTGAPIINSKTLNKVKSAALVLMIAKIWKPLLNLDWYWYGVIFVLAMIKPIYKMLK